MKPRKRSLVAVLVLALVCAIIPVGTALASDTPSGWAAEQINAAIAENLVPENLQSAYNQATTRAEFATLAVTLYEKVNGSITGRSTFTDTKDVNVEKAAFIGVVAGVGDNKFNPDGTLTREQAAVMLSRLSDALEKPFPIQASTFADNGNMSSWAIDSVGRVQAAGIMSGVGDNRFAPQDPYTREQSIVTIMRTFNVVKIVDTTPTQPPTEPTPPRGDLPKNAEGWARAIRDTQLDGGKESDRNIKAGKVLPYWIFVDRSDAGLNVLYIFIGNSSYAVVNPEDWEILD